jgi:hypothetical protein
LAAYEERNGDHPFLEPTVFKSGDSMKNFNVDDVMAAILAAGMGSCEIKDISRLNGRRGSRSTSEFAYVGAGIGDRNIEPIGFSKYYGKNAFGEYVRVVAHQEGNPVLRFIYLDDAGELAVGSDCAPEMHKLTDDELYNAKHVMSPLVKDKTQWVMLDRLHGNNC